MGLGGAVSRLEALKLLEPLFHSKGAEHQTCTGFEEQLSGASACSWLGQGPSTGTVGSCT